MTLTIRSAWKATWSRLPTTADAGIRAGRITKAVKRIGTAAMVLGGLVVGLVLSAPAAQAATFPGYQVAYQASNHVQMFLNSNNTISTASWEINDRGNPSQTWRSDGSLIGAFGAPDGTLFTYTSSSSLHRLVNPSTGKFLSLGIGGLEVAANNRGGWRLAFPALLSEAGRIDVQFVDSSAPDTPITVAGAEFMAGTGASITALSTGGYESAFVGADGRLRVVGPDNVVRLGGGGLVPAPGTTPVIAGDNNGGWIVALHGANNHSLWTLDSFGNVVQNAHALAPNTSPSITGLAHGGVVIAFVKSDGTLWRDWNGNFAPLGGLVPAPGTSPDIAADNIGGWEVALHGANTDFLWTIDSTGHTNNTFRMMLPGVHNPSIAGIPAPDGVGAPPTTPPPTSPPTTPPPSLPQVRSYTVENCSDNIVLGDGVVGPSMTIWVKDNTANTAFVEVSVLPGQVPPSFCPQPATFTFNPITGHTYELRIIGVGGVNSSCPHDLPTGCLRSSFTFQGNPNGTTPTTRINI
jgi:hypothetical protein